MSIIVLQCYISFCCTTKGISCKYTHQSVSQFSCSVVSDSLWPHESQHKKSFWANCFEREKSFCLVVWPVQSYFCEFQFFKLSFFIESPSCSENFCWQVAKWAYLNYTLPVCFILSSNGAIAKQWRDWRKKVKDRLERQKS